jgi:pilus assembly protein CpaC
MITMRAGGVLRLCLLVFAALLFGRDAVAQPRELRVAVSSAQLVEFPRPARSVFIADPAIADVQVPAPDSVIVFGRKPGQTTLIAIGEDNKPVAKIQVIVGYDFSDLRRLIQQDVPNAEVKIAATPNGVILSGVVADDDTAEKLRAAAQRYVGDKDTLINRVQVAGPVQVNLRLRVAEVSRTVTKQLGFNWETIVNPGSFAFGLATGRSTITSAMQSAGAASTAASTLSGTVGVPPSAIANLFNRAPSLGGGALATADAATANLLTKRASVNTLIDALAEEGIVTVLAQPNLTAISGQVASFLAGGEFPVPSPQVGAAAGSAPTVTVTFKPFGVRLDFVPTVMSSDRISIKVRPEVSELTTNGAVEISGFTIPALNVRRAETTVQLGSGESFAIAGLIRNNTSTDISKYPGLGDLPVLGPLFRSSQFQRSETELVIIVTPYVVRPAADGPSLKVPTDGLAPASDIERVFMDRLTKASAPGAATAIGLNGARLRGDAGFVFQ